MVVVNVQLKLLLINFLVGDMMEMDLFKIALVIIFMVVCNVLAYAWYTNKSWRENGFGGKPNKALKGCRH